MGVLTPDVTVEVCNADYRALARVRWQDAVVLVLRGAVHVIATHDPAVHVRGPSLSIELPASVALREYVHVPYRPTDRAGRQAILRRDGFTCGYCGARANTIDHVLPRSRGGGDTWFNLVAACQPCNARKGDRTPSEAGMTLIREPFEPRERERFRF
jgi:5-methylcytosine-specific restriction endonuclease McrA